MVVVMN
jgi:hypothetical protein